MTQMLPVNMSVPGAVSSALVAVAGSSMAAGILFVVLLAGLHIVAPEFDPTWRFVSEYVLSPFGWMMTLAFVALAASLAGTVLVAASQLSNVPGRIGLLVIAVAVVGLLIAAAFKTDPIDTASAVASFSGRMHVLGASLDFTPLGTLLVNLGLARNPAWRPVRLQLFATAMISILCTVAFIVALPPDHSFGPGTYAGLIGRVLLVSYLGWIFTVAAHAIRLGREQE